MVPTMDSTRNIYITKTLLNNKFHVMCPGPTGTGKSLNLYTLLGKEMGDEF
jgi:dynein heavy chain